MFETFSVALAITTTPEGLFLIGLGCVVAFILGVMPGQGQEGRACIPALSNVE